MRFLFCFAIALLLLSLPGCQHVSEQQPALVCQPIYGLDTLLQPGKVILLGEIHGTKEAPRYMYEMACNALQKGLKVTVALELPHEDQAVFEAVLESAEGPERILALPFWSREYQDGRASQAMLDLVVSLQEVRKQGGEVTLLLIDEPAAEDRNLAMAEYILSSAKANPQHVLLALTGNYHNMIHEGSGQMGHYVLQELGEKRVCSLNQQYRIGSAWVATEGRKPGPNLVRGDGMEGVGIMIGTPMLEYHGTFEMDSIHYSPPAQMER